MRRFVICALSLAACAAEEGPTSSKVTLDGETWTATAVSFDELGPVDATVVLAHEFDLQECGWTGFDQVELRLLIGDRSTPHILDPLDVATPFSGSVTYTDGDQRDIRAVSGGVTPTLTTWAFSAEEGHNVVTQIDGELDVVLADGRALSGAFSATPCYPR